MPKGLIRKQLAGDFHFVTFSCYRRLPYLASSDARELMERSLETMRLRYDFVVCGYVLMPEHVHLLVSEPKVTILATALQALKLSVAVHSKERPFWQRRYYDFNVFTDLKRTEKLRYMHRNPVKRGLVASPEEWRWSSYRHYATGKGGTVEIESEWLAAQRGRAALKAHISEARCGAPCTRLPASQSKS